MRISDWSSDVCSSDLVRIPSANRLKKLSDRFRDRDEIPMEVVLHSPEPVTGRNHNYVIDAFESFMRSLDVWCDIDRTRHAGGLAFLPFRPPRVSLAAIPLCRVSGRERGGQYG